MTMFNSFLYVYQRVSDLIRVFWGHCGVYNDLRVIGLEASHWRIAGSRPRVSPPWSWILMDSNGFYMDSIWILYGFYMDSIWILYGFYMDSMALEYASTRWPTWVTVEKNWSWAMPSTTWTWGTKKLKMNLAEWLPNAIWSSTQPLGCVWKWGYPIAGWFIRENPMKMDDLGEAPFMETPTLLGEAKGDERSSDAWGWKIHI